MADESKIQGEGDRESVKRYNKDTQEFVESGKVEESARKAGEKRAKEYDPAVDRDSSKPTAKRCGLAVWQGAPGASGPSCTSSCTATGQGQLGSRPTLEGVTVARPSSAGSQDRLKTDRSGPALVASGDDIELFLCGDVMLGRGIDQILPHPVDPVLRESYVGSALGYVRLAQRAHGPIPRKVGFDYVWGDALPFLQKPAPSARIVNLETSATTCEDFWPKAVNYRMHPANMPVLTAARIDCCTLANNHVLDFGREGLAETLAALEQAGIFAVGAGHDDRQAAAPVRIPVPGGRIVVFSFGSSTSGIPDEWAAGPGRSGVNLLPDLSDAVAGRIARFTHGTREPGDLLVASIHWGGNWGYQVPAEHRRFAHRLIDEAGFDVVHGHSSHHPKGIEIHRNRPILYGCGDFITDYEGIGGYEAFRGDLALMYLPYFARGSHDLVALRLVPFRLRRFRLEHAPAEDLDWLRVVLDRESRRFGSCVEHGRDGILQVFCHR